MFSRVPRMPKFTIATTYRKLAVSRVVIECECNIASVAVAITSDISVDKITGLFHERIIAG